jgi:hypothetical protein
MRRARHIVPAFVLMILLNVTFAADAQRFDGKWVTTVSCEPARGALARILLSIHQYGHRRRDSWPARH